MTAQPTPAVDVSIIVPVFNQFSMTERCLETLAVSTAVRHELIVVDNASTDETPAYLAALQRILPALADTALERPAGRPNPWLRNAPLALGVITNPANRGFVEACNQAAAEASGRYLCFLNNDTEPQPGWLEAMVAVIEGDASVGAVGAKLLFPDGTIQEAGAIVYRDGSAIHYSRGMGRYEPAACYRREVDYCSGAALLVPKALFHELGGFDTRYAPAYYEDTDLCFSIRQKGRKVVYQPHAEVIHHEGGTAGRDPGKGYRAYQAVNQGKFLAKWRDVLEARHGVRGQNKSRDSHRVPGKRILWVAPHLPMYDRAAGSRRLWEILSLLVEGGHHVTFVPSHMVVDGGSRRYLRELQALGVMTFALDPAGGWPPPGMNLHPLQVADGVLRAQPFDLAVGSFHYAALPLIHAARKLAPGLPVLADSVDMHFVRERREAELANDDALRAKAQKTRRAELETYRAADAVIVVTDEDGRHLREHLPGKRIVTIPNVNDPVDGVPGFEERRDLLFVGYFQHPPNLDAVRWLHAEILPRLREAVPGARVHVVGSGPPPEVTAMASDDFIVHGFVQDLAPMLREARVSIAPLRYGAGMKGKVTEALAWGLPCVTTPAGAEGMDLVDGEEVLVASDARSFAAQVARLYGDAALWHNLSQRGQAVARSRYSRQAVRGSLEAMVAEFARTSGP
jgi:GT2 family glycosyltransferase